MVWVSLYGGGGAPLAISGSRSKASSAPWGQRVLPYVGRREMLSNEEELSK